jgi:hypothetical protein
MPLATRQSDALAIECVERRKSSSHLDELSGGKGGALIEASLYSVPYRARGVSLQVSGTEAMQSDPIATYRGVVIYLDWQAEGEPPFLRHHCTYRCKVPGQSLTAPSLAEIKQAIDRHQRGHQS